jgi:chromosome segregation ATPase
MIKWLAENWQGIVGAGTLTSLGNYFANRKNLKADFLTKVENLYSGLADELKSERETLKEEVRQLREDCRNIQNQFNQVQLSYAKEVEQSQNWEKLHRELSDKYNALAKDHETLKKEFESYKKLKK